MNIKLVGKSLIAASVVLVATSAAADPGDVKHRVAAPQMMAATLDTAAEGSFNAGVVSKAHDPFVNRATGAWWFAGSEAGHKGRTFGQAVVQAQSNSGTVSSSVGGVLQATDPVSPAPEPSTYVLLLGGLALVAFVSRRRRGPL